MSRNTFADGEPFSVAALNSMKHAHAQDGVLEGLELSTGSGDRDVDVAAGEVSIGAVQVDVDADTVTTGASDAEDRIDLLAVDLEGDVNVVAGEEASLPGQPVAPEIPEGEVLIGIVLVRGGSGEILEGDIFEEYRTMIDPSGETIVSTAEPAAEEGFTWYNPDTGVFYAAYEGEWYPVPPVTVTQEAVTFDEDDVSVSLDLTEVVDGSVSLLDQILTGNVTDRPTDDDSTSDQSLKEGFELDLHQNLAGVRFETSADSSGLSKGYIADSSATILASADIEGGVCEIEFDMDENVEYHVWADNDGNDYTRGYYGSPSYPYTGEDFDLVTGSRELDGDVNKFTFGAHNIQNLEGIQSVDEGAVTVGWATPAQIKSWDLATYQATEDGETVTVDVLSDREGTTATFQDNWSTNNNSSNYGVGFSPNVLLGRVDCRLAPEIADDVSTVWLHDENWGEISKVSMGDKTTGDTFTFLGSFEEGSVYYITAGSDGVAGHAFNDNPNYPRESDDLDITTGAYSEDGGGTFGSGAYNFDQITGCPLDHVEYSDIGRNYNIRTIDAASNVALRATIERQDTENDPTFDYAARRYTR